MLTLPVLSWLSAAYSVVVLPLPVGPGHEDHALAMTEQALEGLVLIRRQLELREIAAEVVLVQDPDDDFLAASGDRDGGDTKIHRLIADPRHGAAVVRAEWIGHIELCPDLHPTDEGGPCRVRQSHHLTENTVDPVAHHDRAVGRLGVDVARAFADGVVDHRVDQFRDGPIELAVRPHWCRVRIQSDDGSRRQADQQPLDRPFRPIQLVEPSGDRLRDPHLKADVAAGHESQRLLHVEVARIRGRDLNRAIVGRNRDDLMLAGDRLGQESSDPRVRRGKVGKREAEHARDLGCNRLIGGPTRCDDAGPDFGGGLRHQRIELRLRDELAAEQDRREPPVGRAARRRRHRGPWRDHGRRGSHGRAKIALRISRHIDRMLATSCNHGGRSRLIRAGACTA